MDLGLAERDEEHKTERCPGGADLLP